MYVAEPDIDLLLLLKTPPSVAAGRPGCGGAGGDGGRGGRGGHGGAPYSWTESRTVYDTVYNGGRSSLQPRTVTTYHSNPGGMPGPPGRPGRKGMDGKSGRPAHDGTLTFNVANKGTFPWRYDLVVHGDVRVDDEHGYGVLEPGARCLLSYSVRNVGGMPTPSCQDVVCSVAESRWAAPLYPPDDRGSGAVLLPREIPQQSVPFHLPRPIHLLLTDTIRTVVGNPFRVENKLLHQAILTRVNQVCLQCSQGACVHRNPSAAFNSS